jgi:hypothetical protein
LRDALGSYSEKTEDYNNVKDEANRYDVTVVRPGIILWKKTKDDRKLQYQYKKDRLVPRYLPERG